MACDDSCVDADQDGHGNVFCGGDDCDDADPERFPGNFEVCDDVDNDCDPLTVGDVDEDEDGSVDSACCNGSECGRDCDDSRANVSRLAPEVCDGIDNDCDGLIDDGVSLLSYLDADLDGFGDPQISPERVCQIPFGSVERGGDCNDNDAGINPGLADACDGVDSDCDGTIDDGADEICEQENAESQCLPFADGSAACRPLTCPIGFSDCDGDPTNGCEVNLCDTPDHCGACARNCGDWPCYGGLCSGGPPLPSPEYSGKVKLFGSYQNVAGAAVSVVSACGDESSWKTDALGNYSVAGRPSVVGLRVEAEGYLVSLSNKRSPVLLWTRDQLESMSPEFNWSDRHGVVIYDFPVLTGESYLAPRGLVSTSTGTPIEIETANPAIRRVLIPMVAPGQADFDFRPQGPGCSYVDCTLEPQFSLPVDAQSVVYFKVPNSCRVACVG